MSWPGLALSGVMWLTQRTIEPVAEWIGSNCSVYGLAAYKTIIDRMNDRVIFLPHAYGCVQWLMSIRNETICETNSNYSNAIALNVICNVSRRVGYECETSC